MVTVKIEKRFGLTAREARILALVCEGKTDQAIADVLAISIKTVEVSMSHVYDKLITRGASINLRCAAIAEAVARGIVSFSVKSMVLVLMLGAVNLDDKAARVGRCRIPQVQVNRIKTRDL